MSGPGVVHTCAEPAPGFAKDWQSGPPHAAGLFFLFWVLAALVHSHPLASERLVENRRVAKRLTPGRKINLADYNFGAFISISANKAPSSCPALDKYLEAV